MKSLYYKCICKCMDFLLQVHILPPIWAFQILPPIWTLEDFFLDLSYQTTVTANIQNERTTARNHGP